MVFAPFMALERSDWIAIVAIGAGALMGVEAGVSLRSLAG